MLEVTESVFMDEDPETVRQFSQIRELGIRLALDDFGTGYSALGYLRKHRFDKVKIDRSFVKDISTDPEAASIIQAILQFARALGMSVTAEGIETQAQNDFLVAIGCHELQGFLLARPSEPTHISSAFHGQPLVNRQAKAA
jgi:EAL domain-containing protein (putative c-di-GMP-specific phosphodiesterase class I)